MAQHASFEDHQKIIKKYLDWTNQIPDSLTFFLKNSLSSVRNLVFKNVMISPNCKRVASLDFCDHLSVFDFETKELLAKQTVKSCEGFCFSFDSKKVAVFGESELAIFNATNLFIEEVFHFEQNIKEFKFSRNDNTWGVSFAPAPGLEIHQINSQTIKRYDSVSCFDFCSQRTSLCCLINILNDSLIIWDFQENQDVKNIKNEEGNLINSFSLNIILNNYFPFFNFFF